ncbi:MAG: RecQ family ATP-dependent DNA helicase [Opitutales bacterium]|nr:RecQ family ATP-dependent DNA helicase [Opitutales bacterium]
MAKSIVFFDTEIGVDDQKIHDIGAVRSNKGTLHTASVSDFCAFAADADFLCGHNVVHHDMKYLAPVVSGRVPKRIIDTLYLSPLLFPRRPYHKLVKNDKLQAEELNNPVNDSLKSQALFFDEVNAFHQLSFGKKKIFCGLLYSFEEFQGFFDYVGFKPCANEMAQMILAEYKGKLCANADIDILVKHHAKEVAYALALIGCEDSYSVTPPWLLYNFPKIENVIKLLCNTPCADGCDYCRNALDVHKGLKKIFGFDNFRTYNEEPLQEMAARAAMEGKSLLAVFPTGGGKSITFQLPALMAGKATHGLTVVISPLQSLMKDQVDNLSAKGIADAVTVNGMLDPIERRDALMRVSSGQASILYISPEQLRSKTIEHLLMSRNIVRFVIDEAHCFSAWGQDFRVDYLYIGDFIRKLQEEKKADKKSIPVSCFTATAKQKVVTDICDYFKKKLDLDLEIFASSATRKNLHYTVLYKETDEEKYNELRRLIVQKNCPTIVYVSRTKRTFDLAGKLTSDGLRALPYNGKLDPNEKITNQNAFMNNEVSIIVATSAFGMGVDKSDVGLVVHYDISDSLENYVQEAGRAGRNPALQADCYVLFNDNDLDKHFILLNQTKLSISEIQQVWKAIKELTKNRPNVCCSALEIARQAGWVDSAGAEMETRVRTAVSALETAGYIVRGRNVPKVYATSIRAKNMKEASDCICDSDLFTDEQKNTALRIVKSLISNRSVATAGNTDAESRVDYLADILGIKKAAVIESINLMRQVGLLEDYSDMSAYIYDSGGQNKSVRILESFSELERFLLLKITDAGITFGFKELNEEAQNKGITTSNVKHIRTLLHYLTIKNYITKEENRDSVLVNLVPSFDLKRLMSRFERRVEICRFILDELYSKVLPYGGSDTEKKPVEFSLVGLFKDYQAVPRMNFDGIPVSLSDVEDALLYLSKIGALKIEGGFLVLYNRMEIKRLVKDNRIKYKVDDYRLLDEFYKQKIRQIHIVGEYANLMVRDYDAALKFVQDYFNMDFKKFIATYFKDDRAKEIERNITPEKYNRLFGALSDKQSEIINDAASKYIVVAAGPGSGKTRVLVHKLASLLLLEDVKHDQLLMVTFSRAAATEFKKRLIGLIGNAANFVEIKTFHSYCFDLLGRLGTLDASKNVVKDAVERIRNGEVEQGKISKSVLVIDEAQDMDEHEFELVKALMTINDEMRVVAVGDDDQNIYEFRGANSKHLGALIKDYGARKYEMTTNYRSNATVVDLANAFVKSITNRMKSAPIEAGTDKSGDVKITHHACANMEEAVVNDLIATYKAGKACVLTNTNDEALCILGLLLKHGKRARLIQSLDGFSLYNLLEIRVFLKSIDRNLHSPVISDEIWRNAKEKLFSSRYRDSACIDNVRRLISDFEATHSVKYRSDFEEFLNESKFEDFYDAHEQGVICVSTIHKAKGREFDNVYMMLKNSAGKTDAERRALYVGMTRAKSNLYIHTNTTLFERYRINGVQHVKDCAKYGEPTGIMLQMTHKDVVLSFFKDKREIIFNLRSGTKLKLDDVFLISELGGQNIRVAKFSKAFIAVLRNLKSKGYSPKSAEVRFIVAWKGKEDTEETPVVLADIYFEKEPVKLIF